MRAALISMAGQPRDAAGAPLALAGKTLARRQLDFALAAGCGSVIVLGDGGSAEAIALRHAAEAAGARFQAIRDGRGLLGAVRADDDLLVLAPGLLPEAPEALAELGKGRAVLVLPAGAGTAAGFERIDLERAWAGALVVGGAHVERLSDLPADVEPASALLRIALQSRVPEKRLPEAPLVEGSWAMLGEEDGVGGERRWLDRHWPHRGSAAPTYWLARLALRRLALRLLAAPRSVEALFLGALAILAGAVTTVWSGLAPAGFALVVLGATLAQMTEGLARLRDVPFSHPARRIDWPFVARCLVDVAILACAVLAIEGTWLHRLFPPLILLVSLHTVRGERAALFTDRGGHAALLVFAAAFGVVEPAAMAVSLALLTLNLAQTGGQRG